MKELKGIDIVDIISNSFGYKKIQTQIDQDLNFPRMMHLFFL